MCHFFVLCSFFLFCFSVFFLLSSNGLFELSGVKECSNFILLHVAVQFPQHHLLKRLSFLHCIFLPPLSKIRWLYVCRFISGLSILFHWSMFLILCQYHTVMITVALSYRLKSRHLIPPAPFFFLQWLKHYSPLVFQLKVYKLEIMYLQDRKSVV